MITIIKAKLKKSDNQANIDINKVAANITKSGIIIQKLINVKCQKTTCFLWTNKFFGCYTFYIYPTVSGTILPSVKSIVDKILKSIN